MPLFPGCLGSSLVHLLCVIVRYLTDCQIFDKKIIGEGATEVEKKKIKMKKEGKEGKGNSKKVRKSREVEDMKIGKES